MGIGESHGEGFAPGEMPGSMAAAGHVAQLSPDSQRDERRSPTPWCFPLAPEGGPQSQADPASESNQFVGRFAEAEIAAPAPRFTRGAYPFTFANASISMRRALPNLMPRR